jgi:hypothetical protein
MRFPPVFTLIFLLFPCCLAAQEEDEEPETFGPERNIPTDKQTSLDLTYGNYLFRKPFDPQLNGSDHFKAGVPIQSLSLGVSGAFLVNGKWRCAGHMLGAKFLPQDFRVNDSISGVITGCLYTLSLGYDIFPRSRSFDFIFSGGLNLGRTKLIKEKLDFLERYDNTLHVKNMFISPKASMMVKLYVSKFCLTLNAEYAYDISGSDWKEKLLARHKPASVSVPGFNQTGLNVSIGIGWSIPFGMTAG